MADLKEKVGLVTGVLTGFGTGIAEGLAEAGATIYLATGAPADAMETTVATVEALGGRAVPLTVDRSDDEALLELFRRIESESGRLDLLVNDAFQETDPPFGSDAFWEHPPAIWDDHCGIGLRRCYVAAALAARLMVQQSSGLIVNLSGGSRHGQQLHAACGVCEAGMDRMAAEMAAKLAGQGVTALSLAPGAVKTQMAAVSGRSAPDAGPLRSSRFVGRCIAALAMDPDVGEKTGGRFEIEALKREYRFSELLEESS
jgi:NAD(P)-dependent dehydrogenase (short-subunit alcohol dehydrogenase family)